MRARLVRRLLFAGSVAGLAVLALAAGGAAPNLSGMVLQPSDVPAGWTRHSAQSDRSDLKLWTPAEKANYRRNRIAGYEAQFKPTGLPGVGPSAVVSGLTYWKSAKSAALGHKQSIARFFRVAPNPQRLPLNARIGQAAVLLGTAWKVGDDYVGSLNLVWRHGRVLSHVVVGGFPGYISTAFVVELARRQDVRIARQLR
jgi:hypothetical protein